ncbi:unnamed protein product [Arctogadus glacialis]
MLRAHLPARQWVTKCFLVVLDNGGQDARVYPLTAANGRQVAFKFSDYFAGRGGAKTLRMDNATHFKNNYVADLLEGAGIQAIWSAPYMPSTNGVAERCVGRAKEWITANDPIHWDTPASLWRLNAHLSLPPLVPRRPAVQGKTTEHLKDAMAYMGVAVPGP